MSKKNEFADADYLKKLTEEERLWYRRFTSEYYYNRFDSANPKKNLHSKKQKTELSNVNNQRRRDIYNKFKKLNPK